MQVSVIIPTYNEKENIESLVIQLLALPTRVHIIVVDDNSPDGTGEIADRLAVENAGLVFAGLVIVAYAVKAYR